MRQRREKVVGGRRHVRKLKLTETEEAALLAKAAAQRTSVSRLLVESALADGVVTPSVERGTQFGQLADLQRVLAGVANNLNQVARALNSGADPELDQIRAILASIRRLALRIDEAVRSL